MEKIVDILLDQLRDRLKEHHMTLTLTPGALALLLEKGFDPALGARPLRRSIQRLIEDPLADALLRGRVHAGSEIRITKRGDELAIGEALADTPSKE